MEKCEHDYNGVDGGPCIKCGKTVADLLDEQREADSPKVKPTKQCIYCKGSGSVLFTSLGETLSMQCPTCRGIGSVPYHPATTPWVVTIKRGDWTATKESQHNAEDALEQALTQYDIDHFPDRDRLGGMN